MRIKIIQKYVAVREIVIEVADSDPDSALERVSSGEIDIPSFDDDGWRTGWDLQDESYQLV